MKMYNQTANCGCREKVSANRALWIPLALILLCCGATPLSAQGVLLKLERSVDAPPGKIGAQQLVIHPEFMGYFQPVALQAPTGARVAVFADGGYAPHEKSDLKVGMLLGQVYRLKVTDIPNHEGIEVYPTIELIDRTYPPAEVAEKFAIPIQLSLDDLVAAANGSFVIRVIYLENPKLAFPIAEGTDGQYVFDVHGNQDPLQIADRLGRPVAILRIGSRIPAQDGGYADDGFQYEAPPISPIYERPSEDNAVSPDPQAGKTPVKLGRKSGIKLASHLQEPLIGQTDSVFLPESDLSGDCPAPQCIQSISDCPFPSYFMPESVSTKNLPADEYICDGGDAGARVRVHPDFRLDGLNGEDTIAHYDMIDGRTIIEPSNRVCIYAPRFAVVRRSIGVALNTSRDEVSHVRDQLPSLQAARGDQPTTTMQYLAPQRQVGSIAAQQFRDRLRTVEASGRIKATEFHAEFKAFEDLSIIRTGVAKQADRLRIAGGVDAARVWNVNEGPKVYVKHDRASIVKGEQKANEIASDEENPDHPRFRIVKIASRRDALPGDKIDFTIRFDNFGRKTIGNVTIVDSLTTRLEYIPDSAECSIPATFSVSQNEGESVDLRWEITEPMDPKTGGIIRFSCKVR